jgi:chlorite dismutase
MSSRLFHFCAGTEGPWKIESIIPMVGESLPGANSLTYVPDADFVDSAPFVWSLRGIISNERYVTSEEKPGLQQSSPGLGRSEAKFAVLIPIRKRGEWWGLPQDTRRRIFEESSRHIRIGMEYLPAVARRLHHCRDLGDDEPFDFLTWFEFDPRHESQFNQLLATLRATEEWDYVEREVEVRVIRSS